MQSKLLFVKEAPCQKDNKLIKQTKQKIIMIKKKKFDINLSASMHKGFYSFPLYLLFSLFNIYFITIHFSLLHY